MRTIKTTEEELLLWEKLKERGDEEARNDLMVRYYPLAKYLAERMVSAFPATVEVGDLVSIGVFGLIDAINKFKPEMGVQFRTYAATRIRGAILDGMRVNDWVPRLVRLRASRLQAAIRAFYAKFSREPTDMELRDWLGLDEEEYADFRADAEAVSLLSLTGSVASSENSEGGSSPLVDLVEDSSARDPLSQADARESFDILVSCLSEDHEILMRLYYVEDHSMREIAHLLRLSESRVCQMHSKAIRLLRELSGA